jgi:hypothetical protein
MKGKTQMETLIKIYRDKITKLINRTEDKALLKWLLELLESRDDAERRGRSSRR